MKNLSLVSSLMFLLSTGAFAKGIAVDCSLVETPTSVNDSWSLFFLEDKAAFFDNDSFHYGSLVKSVGENEGETDYLVYKNTNKNGQTFKINLESPENFEGSYPSQYIYAELFLGKEHRPSIFRCVKSTSKELTDYFEH